MGGYALATLPLLRLLCLYILQVSNSAEGHAAPARSQEFLSRASAGNEPLLLGRRYFAGMALVRMQSLRCGERMRQLLARPGAETRLEEGALLLVRGSPNWLLVVQPDADTRLEQGAVPLPASASLASLASWPSCLGSEAGPLVAVLRCTRHAPGGLRADA